ncbi:alpha/beta hydrolase family protein [Lentzea sp. CA-135723]|uniref:alpha/beta hydrolase family protein n=1 Tax=Lentzea sp. CA-135723 TaxID=3239950 RepID=UPI003D8A115D
MIVLFAAGGGGDPERHRPLLDHFTARGHQVIAPSFDRLHPQQATWDDYLARPTGLVEALGDVTGEVTVIGHSIGAWAALCLAGATPWSRDREPLDVPRDSRVTRLVLYTPPAGWFAAPGALAAVHTPILAYAGELDTVVPVADVEVLRAAPADVDVRVVPKAGHFGFMHVPPPGMDDDPAFDRAAFLPRLVDETCEFVTRGRA